MQYIVIYVVMYTLCFGGAIGLYVQVFGKNKRNKSLIMKKDSLKPAKTVFFGPTKSHNEKIDFLCNGLRTVKNGRYGLYLVVGKNNKRIEICNVYSGISRQRIKLSNVDVLVEQFLDIKNNAYDICLRVKNESNRDVNITLKSMCKGVKNLYTSDHNKYMECVCGGVTESIKCDAKSRISFIDGGIVCKINKSSDSKLLFSVGYGDSKISIEDIPNLKKEIIVEQIKFIKKYLSVSDLAVLNKALFLSSRVSANITENASLFCGGFWLKSLYNSGVDISKKIYVLGDNTSDETIKKYNKLMNMLEIPICFVSLKTIGKYERKLVSKLDISHIKPEKNKNNKKVVNGKVTPFCYGNAIKVDDEWKIDNINIKLLYPNTYTFAVVGKNEINNMILKEKIIFNEKEKIVYKDKVDYSLLSPKKFFMIKINTGDSEIDRLVNTYLPKMIYRYFVRSYSFSSLYDYVYHTNIDGMDKTIQNEILVCLRRKEYAKLYHYLLDKIGIYYYGNIIKLSCNIVPFKRVNIVIENKIVQKICDSDKCFIVYNGRRYYNICVLKVINSI